jgi:hypothetical protein
MRYLQYHLFGKGIVPKTSSVPLVTGSAIHRGIEHLMNRLRIGQEEDIDTAVGLAVEEYVKNVSDAGFSGKMMVDDRQKAFTFSEQKALAEALIRAWHLVESPDIKKRYKVLSVEREIEPIHLTNGVRLQAKVDAELQEITTNEYHNYSIKSVKAWYEKVEDSYRSDLQGLTEAWAVEQDSLLADEATNNIICELQRLRNAQSFPDKNLTQIENYLTKASRGPKKISAVRFCILIKGKVIMNNFTELYTTNNPLIRGFKYVGPDSIQYAHSWQYPKPENKSGMGTLGKGWEGFNVWEQFAIKDWVNYLFSGQCQPECDNPVYAHVLRPAEMFRNDDEIEEAISEIKFQEEYINRALFNLSNLNVPNGDILAHTFPKRRQVCNFHKGEVCSYKPICWENKLSEWEELYQIRIPHHEAERENGKQN